MSDIDQYSDEGTNGDFKIPGAPGAVVVADDPAAPSKDVSSKRQSLSDLFTIFCSGFALISDGYQNNLMTMTNVVLKAEYKKQYTSAVSTRVSNALLVGEIIGQIVIGLTCDYLGRKVAIVTTTAMIVIGGILATASHGVTINGMFWMMTISRGIVGFGTGGEYPASSTSASEAANELTLKKRGPIFILVTNLPLSFGGPLAVSVFLIVISAATPKHLSTVWRVCFGIGCLLPLTVFYFRIKMLNSKLYRRGAIKRSVPYPLVLRYYWKSLIGTCGAWFLYDFVTFPNGVFSGTIISSVVTNGSIEKTGEWQLLLGSIALPGVLIGAWLCDRLGRKNTMMLGFSGYLVFGLIIGCAYDRITKIVPLFVIFYGLMLSSGNLGPGDMLGLVSSESYATAVRGTCYGISAALGKTGAAVGTEVFTPIQTNLGKKWTFIIAAICGVVGVLVTFFFVPNLTGEDLAVEDEKFRAYLVAHGWDGEMGEEDLKALADKGIPRSIVEEHPAGGPKICDILKAVLLFWLATARKTSQQVYANYCPDFDALRGMFTMQFSTDRSLDFIERVLYKCKDEDFFILTEVADSYKNWYTEHPIKPVCPIIFLGSRATRTELQAYLAYYLYHGMDSVDLNNNFNLTFPTETRDSKQSIVRAPVIEALDTVTMASSATSKAAAKVRFNQDEQKPRTPETVRQQWLSRQG
ncbi:MAG: hypothetical protein Q9161_006461 [Pseudevernia consocians]